MALETIGKYKIIGKIGAGAMGEVYKAHDPVLNREVAIKTISAEMGADDDLRKRFEREAQAAARLNHNNIVKVFDFGEEADKVYMAMELLDGQDLRQVLTARRPDLHESVRIMVQAAEGMAFAHERGIVHRDLKPTNLYIQKTGVVKIVDFGLARFVGSNITRQGQILGTPNYMSPEQFRGGTADARSDVYALGCVFYELLTGQRAFDAPSMHAMLFKVLNEAAAPVRSVNPAVPEALASLVERMLAKDAAQRPQNGGELVAVLKTAAKDLPQAPASPAAPKPPAGPRSRPPSRPRSTPPRPVQPPARGPWLAIAGVGGLVAVAIGVGVALMRRGAPEPTPAPVTQSAQVSALTREVVATQVELARRRLDDGDAAEAARQAEQALKLDPGNAGAKEVLAAASARVEALQKAEEAARSADDAARPAAFWALIQVAPDNPLAVELAPALEARLRSEAAEARKLAAAARDEAVRAGGQDSAHAQEAGERWKEAEAATKARRFASAARAYIAARDLFRHGARR